MESIFLSSSSYAVTPERPVPLKRFAYKAEFKPCPSVLAGHKCWRRMVIVQSKRTWSAPLRLVCMTNPYYTTTFHRWRHPTSTRFWDVIEQDLIVDVWHQRHLSQKLVMIGPQSKRLAPSRRSASITGRRLPRNRASKALMIPCRSYSGM